MLGQLVAGEAALGLGQGIALLVLPLAGGGVECEGEVAAGRVARAGDGLQNQLDGFGLVTHVRRKAALVAHGGRETLLFEQRGERVIDLRAHAQTATECCGAHGHDHELLHVQPVVRVRAAVEDVHHRHGQRHGLCAAQKPVQRDALAAGRRFGAGHGDGERRVGAQDGLVIRAVERDHRAVHGEQVARVHAAQRLVDAGGDILARAAYALAVIELHVVVAQLQRLELAGGCAAGRDGGAGDAVRKPYLRLDGRVSARIEHLAPEHADDFCFDHG